MVSFHTPPLSPSQRKIIPEFENSSKKRKWDDPLAEGISERLVKASTMKSISETELNLATPLPLEWQRCLDINSGEIYFYNTRTQKRTSRDPRASPEPQSSGHMSLDLELNLPCGSVGKNHVGYNFTRDENSCTNNKHIREDGIMHDTTPSWLTIEGDQQEMITAVCKKCHMLVMMCKSSPACPNCKFLHPPDLSPPDLFKRKLMTA